MLMLCPTFCRFEESMQFLIQELGRLLGWMCSELMSLFLWTCMVFLHLIALNLCIESSSIEYSSQFWTAIVSDCSIYACRPLSTYRNVIPHLEPNQPIMPSHLVRFFKIIIKSQIRIIIKSQMLLLFLDSDSATIKNIKNFFHEIC